jgi:hypothetical protein
MLFAYVLLCDFFPVSQDPRNQHYGAVISIPEIFLIIWAGTYGIEEIRQVCISYSSSKRFDLNYQFFLFFTFKFFLNEYRVMKAKRRNYTNDMLNLNTLFALIMFFIGEALRFIPTYGTYLAARFDKVL